MVECSPVCTLLSDLLAQHIPVQPTWRVNRRRSRRLDQGCGASVDRSKQLDDSPPPVTEAGRRVPVGFAIPAGSPKELPAILEDMLEREGRGVAVHAPKEVHLLNRWEILRVVRC